MDMEESVLQAARKEDRINLTKHQTPHSRYLLFLPLIRRVDKEKYVCILVYLYSIAIGTHLSIT